MLGSLRNNVSVAFAPSGGRSRNSVSQIFPHIITKMVKRTGPTNVYMQQLIIALKSTAFKEDVPLWHRIADDLEKPSRQRHIVNVYKLDKCAKDGETLIVPGKVLGLGETSRKLKVAAFTFSGQAVEKIHKAGGKALTIADLLKENPKGKNVRIIG